ncbi:MAG: cysteine-rich small domain-containing protein [Defluviitaleaceae bacterium]|nr:cysteine-rich small domain-containing protein [Defluviitaleaceae bacterium]
MKHSARFFRNVDCEYFPCHPKPDKEQFNCLFCYCPLYMLGDKCGGNPKFEYGVKDCTDCFLPHMPQDYDRVVGRLSQYISEGVDDYFK